MKIDLVVFDLDGTLISSHETIYKATLCALDELKIKYEMPEEKFYTLIGLHFEDIFNNFGFAVPSFEEFINVYKRVYFDYIDYSAVYPGAEETIDFLISNKIKVALLTTKSQDHAERILEHFSMADKFDFVMGRRPGILHKPSPEPLQKISADLMIDMNRILMVGDSEMDIECGKNAGSKTCAVSYGYRSKSELEKLAPDFLISSILDVEKIVNGRK